MSRRVVPHIAHSNRLWVACPVYRDVRSFLKLRENALREIEASGIRFASVQWIAVDDTAGNDPEIRELEGLADVTVVVPPFNLGHQRAIVYGLRKLAARLDDSDFVVTLDSDGEDRPEDFARLLAPLLAEAGNVRKLSLAKRTKRRESLKFRMFYIAFKAFFRALTGTVIQTGNYAAYRGWTARNILSHPYFELCYSSSLVSLSLPTSFVPCERGTRYFGQSRMNFFKLVMHGIRMLTPFIDRIAIRALIGSAGVFGVSASFVLGIATVKFMTAWAVPGWAGMAALVFTLVSFISVGNFMILFTVYYQAQSLSLRGLDSNAGHVDTASGDALTKSA